MNTNKPTDTDYCMTCQHDHSEAATCTHPNCENKPTDTERLDWMIERGAKVVRSKDGDCCWVAYLIDYENTYIGDTFDMPRQAIDAAMIGKDNEPD